MLHKTEGILVNQTITLNVSDLSNGVYMLHIRNGNRLTSHQLIINNELVE